MEIHNKINLYSVFLGYRKAGRIENIENDKEKIINECKKLKLLYKIYKSSEYKNYFIIFSKNEILIEYLFNCHSHNIECSDKKIGALYGYPKCCSENIKKILIKDSNSAELEYTLYNSKKRTYSFIINLFSKNRLYFHVPCSLDCNETFKIASLNLLILEKILIKSEYNFFINSLKGKKTFNGQLYYFK